MSVKKVVLAHLDRKPHPIPLGPMSEKDALFLAEYLHERGISVIVVTLHDPSKHAVSAVADWLVEMAEQERTS